MDPAIIGSMRIGHFRIGVKRDDWDRLVKQFENIGSCDITKRRLMLGNRNATTGWYEKLWETSTIEAVVIDRSAAHLALRAGTYVRLEALALTADPLEAGDKIETAASQFYEVKGVKKHYIGDNFYFRECDLTVLPLHGLTYSPSAPTVEDARYRTKDYLEGTTNPDTAIDSSNLQYFTHIVCYADPDYPLLRVFKDKSVSIIFAIDQPNSTPIIGHDQYAFGYTEHVPIHVLTLDTQLQWLAEAELRRITENYPTGSQRSLDRGSVDDRWLGSHRLYDRTWIMSYRRDLT